MSRLPVVPREKHLFGPVPSRRFGRSLGVDLTPHKVCSFDCVYCECGRTTHRTVERLHEPTPDTVMEELHAFFTASHPPVDVITFSGSGEPTLYDPLGELISRITRTFPTYPLVVLTNGSLLSDGAVRAALSRADVVVPSLDAPSEELFRAINRPHPSLRWADVVDGLVKFREEYRGAYHLEVFLLKGFNDGEETVRSLAMIARRINPTVVELNTLARPGTLSDLRGIPREEMERYAAMFSIPCRVIGAYRQRGTSCEGKESSSLDAEERIIEVLRRRPCLAEDLADSLGISLPKVREVVVKLERQRRITRYHIGDQEFYLACADGC